MAKITLTFVCAFPIGGKESAKGSKKSSKKEKPSKKKKKGKEPSESEMTEREEDKNYCAIDVGNITNYMHVEYSLLPESEPCKVDLVSWGPVSKVGTHDEVILLKTIPKSDLNWSIFSVEHSMQITNDDIAKLKSHYVKININLTKTKVSDKLKSDKTKTFFVNKNIFERGDTFMNIFDNKESAENQDTKSIESTNSIAKVILSELMQFPIEDELFLSLSKLPAEFHRCKVLELIDKVTKNAEIDCLNSNIEEYVHIETGKKGKKGKEKKPKKSKKKKSGEIELQFPGELFITDSYVLALEVTETNPNLPRAFVLISVFNFMTVKQKKIFNPLTIRIHNINNLPLEPLIQNGFNSIYADCEIGNFLQYKTREVFLKKNVQLKDHRVFYTDTCTPFQYYEAIHNGFFKIKIFGRLLKKELNPPKLFGYEKNDKKISKPIYKSDLKNNLLEMDLAKTDEVLLFVAYVRLNTLSLHSPSLKFTKLENCIHPNNITVKLADDSENSESAYTHLNPLTDEILLTNNTSIDVDIEISIPFTIPNIILTSEQYFRRIIVIVYNKVLAKDILTSVLLSNQEIFGPNLIIPNYFQKENTNFENFTNIDNVITGFAVDMENFCFMYYEGLCERKMKDLWVKIQIIKSEDAKILYKSDCLFEKRLYNNFIPFGGIFIITLQMGLKFVVTNKNIFLSGTHSVDCRRALQKILLIHRTNMINDISFTLLPTVQELISLDIECGVQLHLKSISGINSAIREFIK